MALLQAQRLVKHYGGRELFSGVSFEIAPGERIGLVGVNGCGKTTLLRLLAGEEEPDAGRVTRAAECRVTWLAQQQPDAPELTLLDTALLEFAPLMELERQLADVAERLARSADDGLIRRQARLQEEYQQRGGLTYRSRTRAVLLGLGFSEEALGQPVRQLSGGEARKAMLARVLLSEANLLLLDEPTNHLDIPSREALETALTAYDGTMLIVTHDRYFVDRVADRILVLDEAGLTGFSGDWTAYSAALRRQREEAAARRAPQKPARPANDYVKKRDQRAAVARARDALARAEARVAEQERLLAACQARMAAPEIAADYAAVQREAEEAARLSAALEPLYAAWQEADAALQALLSGAEGRPAIANEEEA